MRVADFHFDLPEELIAQEPPAERGASRMLVLDRHTGALADRHFRDLPDLLRPGDLLVLNDTRVLPARLFARRSSRTPDGTDVSLAQVEVLLTEPAAPAQGDSADLVWNALVRPAKKVRGGDRLLFFADRESAHPLLEAEVIAVGAFGERTLRFAPVADFVGIVERIGHMPLPPYIRRPRDTPDRSEDRQRYQTIYARREAMEHQPTSERGSAGNRSAAAPTAGLHFTPKILAALAARGIETAMLTLHVGRGTFQPVRVETTEEIRLHAERYTLSPETAAAVNRARGEGRRIVAVGTTTTRTLEHCSRLAQAQGHAELTAGSGETSLFLSPGDRFEVVSGLVTNFHLPESTLLMLVSALAGREHVLHAYRHAVRERFRFFSYGDCMLIL